MTQRRRYLVTYDVADDRRRDQVFSCCMQHGDHTQFSVFVAELSDKEMVIEVAAAPQPQPDATLWVLPVTERIAVKIEKGEMAGREAVYANVVRKLVPAGMWNGQAMRVALPREGLMPPDATACVALLQRGKVGPILG